MTPRNSGLTIVLTLHVDPANAEETLARLEGLVRAPQHVEVTGRLAFDFRSAEVWCDGRRVKLSALELALLRYLVERGGEIVTRQELLDHVWGCDAMPVTRTVDVRIAQLRRKLGPEFIATIHGLGYKFVAAGNEQITKR